MGHHDAGMLSSKGFWRWQFLMGFACMTQASVVPGVSVPFGDSWAQYIAV